MSVAERSAGTWTSPIDLSVDRPATPQMAAGILLVAAMFDLAMRSEVAAASSTVCVAMAAFVMLASGRITNPHGVALIAAAPVFGLFLMLRTSDWLVPLNVIAAAGLLTLGASLARGGSAFDLTIPDTAARALRAGLHGLMAPVFLIQGLIGSRSSGRMGAVARGILLVVPIALIVGALLSSADAVFASFFDVDISDAVLHAVLIGIGVVAFGGLLRLASSPPQQRLEADVPKLGMVESGIMLGALNVLLGAFTVARLVALSEGGQRVLDSAGLSYAEYARSGFLQLLAVAVIVIGTLLVLRAVADARTDAQRRAFTGLSLGVVTLTLAVCVSAFQRLVLYEDAFGLTMLRIYVQTAIVWVAIVLVMLGIAVAARRVRRAWLAPAAAVAALVLLVAMNIFNPEAFVARHNVSNPPVTDELDAGYLAHLSDDAVPEVATSIPRSVLCTQDADQEGWASFNAASKRAQDVRAEICGG